MRSYDLSPLFRSTIGYDRLSRLLETAMTGDDAPASYPPYNIEKLGEDHYRITMAVAGFGPEDLEITAQQNSLLVKAKAKKEEEAGQFLYRGIAGRAFERRFQLADYIKVTSANLLNGLLHVEMVREVPEAMKPRTIQIATGANDQPAITHQAA
ncbi:Hsp20 family protein [Azospirillum sp. SYSU D00513]|uniref:Hsp20 family protein n=1 Tax=Azospirillum sp. SYSU D00513 TaxID=2812561 RepID=UPI001A9681A8|nr:Hsp20 family protein [Azospirillum sp. SYSU D00513]